MWHPHSNKPQKICRVNHFKINFQPHTAHFCDDKIFRLPVKMTRSLQFFSWYSIPALRLNASIKAVSCNTCNWGKTLLKNDIINNKIWIILARQRANCAQTNYIIRDANLWRSQIWRFFLDQYPPQPNLPMQPPPPKFFFDLDPPAPSPPPHKQFCGKNVNLTVRDFNWLNTHPIRLIFIGVTKKKLSSFCLQQTMCIMQENEARNCNTSISHIILEFWNFGTYGV